MLLDKMAHERIKIIRLQAYIAWIKNVETQYWAEHYWFIWLALIDKTCGGEYTTTHSHVPVDESMQELTRYLVLHYMVISTMQIENIYIQ